LEEQTSWKVLIDKRPSADPDTLELLYTIFRIQEQKNILKSSPKKLELSSKGSRGRRFKDSSEMLKNYNDLKVDT